eukprot:TCONS_00004188-protein
MPSLSRRACTKSKGQPNLLHTAWYRHHQNPYHPQQNPDGIINLGTAENRLLFDLIQEKLADIKLDQMHESYTHYCKLSGTDAFRQKLSAFFNRFMHPQEKIVEQDVYVMNGCGTVIETIGRSICNEGDGVLIPAPYYTGFKSDLEQRIAVKTIPVHLDCQGKQAFQITLQKLEEALEGAEDSGIPVKALLLSNPNNPLGTVYTEEELEMMAEFCYNNDLHLVCDEIYLLSVYDQNASFKSLLSIKNFHKYRDHIHVVWGFSKDFSLSGFRVGVAITKNEELQHDLGSQGYYTSVSTVTQYILEEMITDSQWLDKLVQINHQRLQQNRNLVAKKLSQTNIPFVYPQSGLFVWMNLSKCMKDQSLQNETELFEQLMNNGLYLVPGQAFETKENGWFRMIISNEYQTVELALKRLLKTVRNFSSDFVQSIIRKSITFEEIGHRRGSTETVVALETSIRKLRNKQQKEMSQFLIE